MIFSQTIGRWFAKRSVGWLRDFENEVQKFEKSGENGIKPCGVSSGISAMKVKEL